MDISYLMMYRFHIELGLLIIFVPFHAKEMIYVTVALVFLFCFIFRLFLLFFLHFFFCFEFTFPDYLFITYAHVIDVLY